MATTQVTTFPPIAGQEVAVVTWAALGDAEAGDAVCLAQYSDRSVQIDGTFGGATVVLEGSNDGVTYFTLTDPQTTAISKTAAALEAVSELTLYIRPRTSGGTGSSVKVTLIARKSTT